MTAGDAAGGIRRANEYRMMWRSHINSCLVGLVSGSGVSHHLWPALLIASSDGCLRGFDSDDAGNEDDRSKSTYGCL